MRNRDLAWSASRLLFAGLLLAVTCVVAGCGVSGDANSTPSVAALSVTVGSTTRTVRTGRVTQVPFAETVIMQAIFERPIYGSTGQTEVFATASPSTYRIEPRTPRNRQTFTCALISPAPGTVEVRIYESRDAQPITFTLQLGE